MAHAHQVIRSPFSAIVAIAAICLGAISSGCGTRPPALPPVTRDQLPTVWLDSLSARVCPEPLRAHLSLRLESEGRRGVTLDGTLTAAFPDTMQVGVRLGAFRPIFALRADADSCQLLVHNEAIYWTTPRDTPDWSAMNPSAWIAALGWALCPRDLFRRLEPLGPGRIDRGKWHLEGRLIGTPFTANLEVDISRGSLLSLQVIEDDLTLLDVGISRFLSSAPGWVPTRIYLDSPVEGLRIRARVENLTRWAPKDESPEVILRPAGWKRVRASLPLPVPEIDHE